MIDMNEIEKNLEAFSDNNLGIVFGQDTSGSQFSSDVFQFYPDTCAIRSQEIIMRDYGIEVPQEALRDISEQCGWYSPGQGTPMEHVGKLLDLAGVSCHQSENNTVFDLMRELSQGHRVIVGVDSGELWADNFFDKVNEMHEDAMGIERPDHALIVAGVKVDPINPKDVRVILTDPGQGTVREEYTFDQFYDAWKDSNCFMVSTEEPAPYQYDSFTGQEIPSGFATMYEPNPYVIENDFFIPDDDLFIPDDYTAFYTDDNPFDCGIDFPDTLGTPNLVDALSSPWDDNLLIDDSFGIDFI